MRLYVQEVAIQDAIYGVILGNVVSLALSVVPSLGRVLLEAVRAARAPVLLVHCLQHVFKLDWPRCEKRIGQSQIGLWLLRDPESSLESCGDLDYIPGLRILPKVGGSTLIILRDD